MKPGSCSLTSLNSTPLYQLLTHALESPTNKTKFTLLFSNVTEKDILLREEFDALKKKYSDKFDLVYLVDKPSESWKGQLVINDVDLRSGCSRNRVFTRIKNIPSS